MLLPDGCRRKFDVNRKRKIAYQSNGIRNGNLKSGNCWSWTHDGWHIFFIIYLEKLILILIRGKYLNYQFFLLMYNSLLLFVCLKWRIDFTKSKVLIFAFWAHVFRKSSSRLESNKVVSRCVCGFSIFVQFPRRILAPWLITVGAFFKKFTWNSVLWVIYRLLKHWHRILFSLFQGMPLLLYRLVWF